MTTIALADLTEGLPLEDRSVDLVFTSPPYEDARTYGIDFDLAGDQWIKWAADGFMECLRVCNGLVAWVLNGRTKNYAYSCIPERLTAALYGRGVTLRHSIIYQRYGIPGGGPDWPRNIWETVICATATRGPLPWCDIKATGHPPKYPRGGSLSHRGQNDQRVNHGRSPLPELTKAVDVIDCGAAGGGNIGSRTAHSGEAPFPEKLVQYFILTFCPPGGVVLDPMCGTGTTPAVAVREGRRAIAYDIRQSQIELTEQRVRDAKPSLFAGVAE